MFKRKDITKEGKIENFFNKLFSPKNYHLLSSQIFFSTPARFVSSRSQSEHDLIFFWLNLPPLCPAGYRGDERHLEPRLQAVRILFSCPWARNLRLFHPRPPLHAFHVRKATLPPEKKISATFLLLPFFTPSFPSLHTRNDRGSTGEKGPSQWIHLKREYDYSYSSRGKIFLRIYRRKFVPLRRNLPSLKETEVRRWRRSRKKARVLS